MNKFLERIHELEPIVARLYEQSNVNAGLIGKYNFYAGTYVLNVMLYNRFSKRSYELKYWKKR